MPVLRDRHRTWVGFCAAERLADRSALEGVDYIYCMSAAGKFTGIPSSPIGSERFARRGNLRLTALLAVLGVLVSMVVMAPPASAAVADAPTAVTAVGFDRSAAVWFTAPASNGGATITGYTVTAVDSTTSANGGQTCTTTDPSAGCTVAGLTNGDSYTFTVTATNSSGTSAASTASSAVVPAVVTVTSLGYTSTSSHSCAVLSNGTAQCWGSNYSGQLGDDTIANSSTPVRVKGVGGVGLLTSVSSIATGQSNTCAVLTTGYVDCWGANAYGQLGINTSTASSTPKQVYAVGTTDGSSLLSGVSSIATGANHMCALLTAGGVNCWGLNTSGQLGINSTTNQMTPVAVWAVGTTDGSSLLSGVSSIATGSSHTCALLTAGGVDCWGYNNSGQLGNNSTTNQKTPVAVYAVGNANGSSLLSGVSSIATGSYYTCALLTAGGVDCWGNNTNGQLGNNSNTTQKTPVAVYAVGNANGSSLLSGVSSVTAGSYHTCALLTAGGVDCWGYNTYGQLGINSTTTQKTPVAVYAVGNADGSSLLSGVSSLGSGTNHMCALLTAGGVNCWGYNNSGQLGDNTTTRRTTPVAVIAAAPTSPIVASGGAGAAAVSWTGSLSALTYTVTATDTTTPANGGQTCVSSTVSCTVSGLTVGDSYTFAVTAYTGFLTSAASESSLSYSVPATAPSSPMSLVATPGNGSVSIAFTAGFDGGSAITNYEYQLNGAGSWVALSPADGTSPVSIAGLTNGTSYTVKLRAVNSVGSGAESVASDSFTPRTTPSAPTSLVATPGNGSVSVAFTAGADGGASITKYQYRLGAGSWVDAGLTSPISITGLTNYSTYSIQVRAVNAAGPGAASVAVTARPQLAGPTIGVAYSSGKQGAQVGFAFTRPAGTTLVGFTVRAYAKGTDTVVSSCQSAPSGRSCYVPSLTSGTEYDIRVQAYFTLAGETKVRESLESATSRVRVNS